MEKETTGWVLTLPFASWAPQENQGAPGSLGFPFRVQGVWAEGPNWVLGCLPDLMLRNLSGPTTLRSLQPISERASPPWEKEKSKT